MSKKRKEARRSAAIHPSRGVSHGSLQWAYGFLFILAIALYVNTLGHDFAFDDSVVITGNKYTLMGFDGIPTLATKDLFYGIYGSSLDLEGGRWRPLTLIMFAIEYDLFGDNATPYHVINVLLYGVTVMVLFMTLLHLLAGGGRQNKYGVVLAFLTCLLFVAHPIHTEVVANIKSRDEILSFLFLTLSLFFVSKRAEGGGVKMIAMAVLCYFIALLSKESGITYLAVIPLALFCFKGKDLKQSAVMSLPFWGAAVVYIIIRKEMVGMIGDRVTDDVTDNPFLQLNFPDLPTPLPFGEKFATVCWIVFRYLALLVFPHPLTSDYGFNEIPALGFSDIKFWLALFVFLALSVFALREIFTPGKNGSDKDRLELKRVLAFSILFFLFTISIVSNLFFLIGTNMGERFAFISSLGFCLALAALLIHYLKWKELPMDQPNKMFTRMLPLLVILVPYAAKTITRNPDWKNNESLFTADVKTSTGSANAHYYYANTLFTSNIDKDPSPRRDSIFHKAKEEFRIALGINPYFHYCYYNIGMIWEKLGNPDSAIYYHEKTISLKPENPMAQYMAKGALGLVYGKLKGDFKKAIPLLKEALIFKPEDTGYHENLGICYAMSGDFDASLREFETSLSLKKELKKEDGRIFMNMALTWQNKGNKQKADEYFQKAFQLDPGLKK